jgi:hypothetical protein
MNTKEALLQISDQDLEEAANFLKQYQRQKKNVELIRATIVKVRTIK